MLQGSKASLARGALLLSFVFIIFSLGSWFFAHRARQSRNADLGPVQSLAQSELPVTMRIVDINRASEEELIAVPGIGPSLARRIVEDRNALGRFESVAALTRVKGIGEKMIARIERFLSVGDEHGS